MPILYRYLDIKGAIPTLESGTLKVSRLSDFNDPFEVMYSTKPIRTREELLAIVRRSSCRSMDVLHSISISKLGTGVNHAVLDGAAKALKMSDIEVLSIAKELNETMGRDLDLARRHAELHFRVCCFAEHDESFKEEVLLWSHYAQRHEGVRLSFELPENSPEFMIGKVVYENNMIEVDLANDTGKACQEKVIKALFTKHAAWSYENESRMLATKWRTVTGCGLPIDLIDFKDSWLKRIDFGIKTTMGDKKMISKIVRSRYPHVRICNAVCHPRGYKIAYS